MREERKRERGEGQGNGERGERSKEDIKYGVNSANKHHMNTLPQRCNGSRLANTKIHARPKRHSPHMLLCTRLRAHAPGVAFHPQHTGKRALASMHSSASWCRPPQQNASKLNSLALALI